MAEERWAIAIAILEHVYKREQEGALAVSVSDVAEHVGIDPDACYRELQRLTDSDYIHAESWSTFKGGDASGFALYSARLGEKGVRAIGVWPSSDPFAEMLAAIESRAGETDDVAERSKLEAVAAAFRGLGSKIGSALAVEMAKRFVLGNILD